MTLTRDDTSRRPDEGTTAGTGGVPDSHALIVALALTLIALMTACTARVMPSPGVPPPTTQPSRPTPRATERSAIPPTPSVTVPTVTSAATMAMSAGITPTVRLPTLAPTPTAPEPTPTPLPPTATATASVKLTVDQIAATAVAESIGEQCVASPPKPAKGFIGDPARGKMLYVERGCSACHGDHAQGDVGPKLAGTTLSFEAVIHQLREPRGVMQRYLPADQSDADECDVYLYVKSLKP